MARRKSAKPTARSAAAPAEPFDNGYTERSEWEGFKSGDPVKITGDQGRYMFLRHVTNRRGDQWVDLWGGKPKRYQFRSVACDRIRAPYRHELKTWPKRLRQTEEGETE